MSDFAPIAVLVMMGAWQPTDEQVVKAAERARLKAQRDAEDAARAVSGKTSLVCIAGFTIVEDENPNGRTISPGGGFRGVRRRSTQIRRQGHQAPRLPKVMTGATDSRRSVTF